MIKVKYYYPKLLIVLWVAMQLLCWQYYGGPHLMGDGFAYLSSAQRLIDTGFLIEGHYRLYAGYIVFIALFIKLGLGLNAVVLTQIALSGLATLAFYRITYKLADLSRPVAFITTIIWISWVNVQAYNSFILTESLFTSCLIFCLWILMHLRNCIGAFILLLLIIYAATIRPNGFVVLVAAIVTGLISLWRKGQYYWVLIGGIVGVMVLIFVINAAVLPFNLVTEYVAGTVIFSNDSTRIISSDTIKLPPSESWPVMQLGWFIMHNFYYFCHLCLAKIGYFLGYPRAWYSYIHRVWAFTILPSVYALAIIGLMRRKQLRLLQIYLITAILMQIGIVMLTTEDWDGRFLAPFVAYWLQLAIIGYMKWFGRSGQREVLPSAAHDRQKTS